MPELYFEFERGADAGQMAQKLQDGLHGIGSIKTAETTQSSARLTGLEILAVVTIGTQVVHHAKEISDDLRAIIVNVKAAFDQIAGLAKKLKAKDVFTTVEGKRKSIGELTEEDYRTIAEDQGAAGVP